MTTTYDSVGNAEDVKDAIFETKLIDQPMLNVIKDGKASGKLHEWQKRDTTAPGENARPEGADIGTFGYTPTAMMNNRCQLMDKPFKISDTLEEIKKHGRSSELKDQSTVKLRELKNDIEYAFNGAGKQTRQTGDGNDVPDKMDCAQVQIHSDCRVDHGAAFTASNGEASIKAGQLATYNNGGNVETLLINPIHADPIAGFAQQSGRNRDVEEKRLVDCIDIIDTPHGSVSVVKGRYMDISTILGLDSEFWSADILQKTKMVPLAITGHNQKMMWKTELTLACLNDKTSFVIENITTS
ncbi:SU10 major capsid protein [Microbulbifer epialgicus]|uniref:DUF5309 family protein n=1 Tax=Microbulbifer epialgicus TaxID=393907 RepID=A0ABV4P5D1_9GAMM